LGLVLVTDDLDLALDDNPLVLDLGHSFS
jgi:hypothetical protein